MNNFTDPLLNRSSGNSNELQEVASIRREMDAIRRSRAISPLDISVMAWKFHQLKTRLETVFRQDSYERIPADVKKELVILSSQVIPTLQKEWVELLSDFVSEDQYRNLVIGPIWQTTMRDDQRHVVQDAYLLQQARQQRLRTMQQTPATRASMMLMNWDQ